MHWIDSKDSPLTLFSISWECSTHQLHWQTHLSKKQEGEREIKWSNSIVEAIHRAIEQS